MRSPTEAIPSIHRLCEKARGSLIGMGLASMVTSEGISVSTPVLTSRSRIVSYLNCARLGFLSYDFEGHGLEPVSQSLPLANGIAIHDGLALILTGSSPSDVISKILA
jgi:hypothetical protein